MRIVSTHKIINVRVSATAFEYIKAHAPFVNKDQEQFKNFKDVLQGNVAICQEHQIQRMAEKIEFEMSKLTDKNGYLIKKYTNIKCELSYLYEQMTKEKSTFAHIMAEI